MLADVGLASSDSGAVVVICTNLTFSSPSGGLALQVTIVIR